MGILDIPIIARTRRSHALEHATIQLLSRRRPTVALTGRSAPDGFYIYGRISTQEVQSAVQEALSRLRGGASHLAVHSRCGTNLVTAGILAGLVSFLTMLPGDDRSRRERLPLVLLFVTLTLFFAQPLGPLVQQHVTTEADLSSTTVMHVTSSSLGRMPVHRVRLEHK
jgi:hypothetical protein